MYFWLLPGMWKPDLRSNVHNGNFSQTHPRAELQGNSYPKIQGQTGTSTETEMQTVAYLLQTWKEEGRLL